MAGAGPRQGAGEKGRCATMQALADHRSDSRDLLAQRLQAEFAVFSNGTVERCVADVQACMTHLGVEATPALVERIAREHLIGMVKSEPPSGRTQAAPAHPRPRPAFGPDGDR